MFKLELSDSLQNLAPKLDEKFEAQMIARLPFPIAYQLNVLRENNYEWELLVKDTLMILLRYLALIGVSEYLHERAMKSKI